MNYKITLIKLICIFSANGIESFVAVTQFEPIYARRCFPCWDEPDYKATFDIKLIIVKGLTALSNMVNIKYFLFYKQCSIKKIAFK